MSGIKRLFFLVLIVCALFAAFNTPLLFAGSDGGDNGNVNPEPPPLPPPEDPLPVDDEEPSGPTQDEIDAALEERAKELGKDVSELTDEERQQVIDDLQAAYDERKSKESDDDGDPVLVTSGRYTMETTDIKINGSVFNIKRKYLSDEKTCGSMGTGWLVSLDSRIIRGITVLDNDALHTAEKLTAEISELYRQIANPSIANSVYRDIYLPALAKLESFKTTKLLNDELYGLNQYVRFSGAPSYYEVTGIGKLTLIDEDGTPVVFEPSGGGVWIPVDSPQRLYMRIETKDGKGAQSTAGFLLYGRGGVVREYNGNGLLINITQPDNTQTQIIRDENSKAVRVVGPHKNEWIINYSGNFISSIVTPAMTEVRYKYTGSSLAGVTDTDTDSVEFVYGNGRLNEIKKPDNSSIKIHYGYTGPAGTMLVTATTNEEGADEQFEYYPLQHLTVYTNYSGLITRHYYDESHRTVRTESADGSIRTCSYNAAGQLERENINGFETNYIYDSRGNIAQKIYSGSKRETWEWNNNDRLTMYTDTDNIVTEYRYDTSDNCTGISRGGILVFTGIYDSANRLTSSREGDRAEIKYGYDGNDYLTARIITAGGREIRESWKYDGLGRVTGYTDGAGRVNEYFYFKNQIIQTNPLKLETSFFYSNRKDLVRIIEKDLLTGLERKIDIDYDKRHLPLAVTDGTGNITRYEYRPDGKMTKKIMGPWYLEYNYDFTGRINSITRGMAGSDEKYTESYSYTSLAGGYEYRETMIPGSGVTGFNIDPWGAITSITNALGEVSARTLNGAGNATREQGSSGGFYEYSYDSMGRLAQAGREGENSVHINYNRDSSVAEKIDRLGNVTRYTYDERGLPAGETNALGEEKYFYDNAGRITGRQTLNSTGIIYSAQWQYNDADRTVTVTAGGKYTGTIFLNAWGETVKLVNGEGSEKKYEYDSAGRIAKIIDGYGRPVSVEWNELEKISAITYIDNMKDEYSYDHLGNLKKIRNAAGVFWAGEYDQGGRLIKETGWPGLEKEYCYDAVGRVTEVRNNGVTEEKYVYADRGRETFFIDGSGASFLQKKNAYGEITGEVNRLQDIASYNYDAEGRPVLSAAFSGKQTKTEYHDALGLTVTAFAGGGQSTIERDKSGNIISAVNETAAIRYRYDTGGRLIEQVDDSAKEITRYTYDRAGQRIRMTSGDRDVTYSYGKNGELLKVTDQGQRLQVDYEYDERGRETRRTFGNGVKQETFYDIAGRVVLIRELDAQGLLLRAEGYVYDNKGRRSHSVDEKGLVTRYEYDRQSRLAAVLYPWTSDKADSDRIEAEEAGLYFTPDRGNGERYSLAVDEYNAVKNILNRAWPFLGNSIGQNQMMWRETYSYDSRGNRITKTTPWGTVTYGYDAENRLLNKGDILYVNDKDGNLINEKGLRFEASYVYNDQNRMVYSEVTSHVDETSASNVYEYDAFGRRTITSNTAGLTQRTLYDGFGFEIIRRGQTFTDKSLASQSTYGERYRWITDQSGSLAGSSVILYGKGEAVAIGVNSGGANLSMYLGKDIQGSVRSVTTAGAASSSRYEYDAFGQPYSGDLSGAMNLGYTCKPFDTSARLYNYGFRDYRPASARFTTIDPVRDGNNWYAYVNNDPVNWVDLWGLATEYDYLLKPTDFTEPFLLNENARNLIAAQDITREADMYEKGGGGRYPSGAPGADATFCNQATFDIALATGFNADALFNGADRDNVKANTAADNLAAAAVAGTVTVISELEAQRLANMGYTVVAASKNDSGNGHLATVVPDPTKNMLNISPTISNVGAVNGVMNANDAFKGAPVVYYYDKNQQFDKFDLSNVAQRQEPLPEPKAPAAPASPPAASPPAGNNGDDTPKPDKEK
ncbi:MAG: DUF6531 domain-containing protein [Treponema sp.]|nr:DUF6531 domain-containing protein [Treponema sp.]